MSWDVYSSSRTETVETTVEHRTKRKKSKRRRLGLDAGRILEVVERNQNVGSNQSSKDVPDISVSTETSMVNVHGDDVVGTDASGIRHFAFTLLFISNTSCDIFVRVNAQRFHSDGQHLVAMSGQSIQTQHFIAVNLEDGGIGECIVHNGDFGQIAMINQK